MRLLVSDLFVLRDLEGILKAFRRPSKRIVKGLLKAFESPFKLSFKGPLKALEVLLKAF